MIPVGVPIYLCFVPIDMRCGFDALSGFVKQELGREPLSEGLFVFFNRRLDRTKILWWDRTGYALVYKRLERGTFRLPEVVDLRRKDVVVDDDELGAIFEGVQIPRYRRTESKSRLKVRTQAAKACVGDGA